MDWKFGALALVAIGCTPELGEGLSGLRDDRDAALGDRAVLAGSLLMVQAPGSALAGLEIASDDPAVLDAVAPADLPDAPADAPDTALFHSEDDDTTGLVLEARAPGTVRLSLLDPDSGQEVDHLELEVAEAAATRLRPAGRWHLDRELAPRVLAGRTHFLVPVPVDADGDELAATTLQPLELPAGPAGEVVLAGQTVTRVDSAELVGIELLPARRGELRGLVVVGLDRDGREVAGVDATWTGVSGEEPGDVVAWLPGADRHLVEARVGDDVVSAEVAAFGAPVVGRSDDPYGCASAPAPGALGALLLAIPALRRRRP